MNQQVLQKRWHDPENWANILNAYQASSPYNYAVIDDFLVPEIVQELHKELLNHSGWSEQTHREYPVISNMKPNIEVIFTIAQLLKANCPDLLFNYELVDHWALMYSKNVPGTIHSDVGALTLNIWLTPDRYNLASLGGGLLFFDVKRPSSISSEKSPLYFWSEQYLKDFTKGGKASVSYKCNRAILFDAKTFHQTDSFFFANSNQESQRINLALVFDEPSLHEQQVSLFKNLLNTNE